eukprot:TRINITY_DN104480_c0_g1_i1.p1 TRINITY_DN104480_c0_g1~~TRINITY_DN104480_c0_g1_i1.p1  ORF type:complete len:345 (+),score=101.71 TRINITY_DN104480_c0_g1_i1:52-1086(+)
MQLLVRLPAGTGARLERHAFAGVALPSRLGWLSGPTVGALTETKRAFGSTEGPFLGRKPDSWDLKDKKKHFNEVLIMADRRKLLETVQDLLDEIGQERPKAFWEILAKRCQQSLHLLNVLELAMVARAFDAHEPKLRKELDIFAPLAMQVRNARDVPGLAVIVLSDVLPRQMRAPKEEVAEVMRCLARRAADVMWEIPPVHAVKLIKALSDAGVNDVSLCSRVARKLRMLLQHGSSQALPAKDLGVAAAAFAAQDFRDLELFKSLAEAVAAALQTMDSWQPSALEDAEKAAWQVLESLDVLDIKGLEEAKLLRRALGELKGEKIEEQEVLVEDVIDRRQQDLRP